MAPTYITSSVVLAEALACFKNNLRMGNAVHRVDAEYQGNRPKIGSDIQIENPWRFEVQDGPVINTVDLTETSVTLSVNAHKVVPITVLTKDKTLSIHDFRKKYLEDAMIKLANQVDSDLLGLYVDVYSSVGTAGTTPSTYNDIGLAAGVLDYYATPPGNRNLILDPVATYKIADAIKTVHNEKMAEEYIKNGKLTDLIGMGGLYSSQNVKFHTAGTHDTGYLVDETITSGDTDMNLDGGTGTILDGDICTIYKSGTSGDKIFSVNPVSYLTTGQAQGFVCTADESTGGDNIDFNFAPAANSVAGPSKNIDQLPANNAGLVFLDSHRANLAFHKTAFCMASVPFELPETAPVAEQLTADGITMTLTGGFDVTNYREIYRLDILYGVKTLRPEWAVRVLG